MPLLTQPSGPSIHCDFCDELSGGVDNAFYARYRESTRSRILFATENFRAFPTIGQLVEGYVLVVPVSHYSALDEMPSELLPELAAFCGSVRTAISQSYGPSVCFEHGARKPLNGGCGIYHAHLHIVPWNSPNSPRDLAAELKESFPCRKLETLADLAVDSDGKSPYLFYEDTDHNRYRFSVGNLPSQYMRRLVAESLGIPDWDWRAAGREERLLATLNRLSERFNACVGTRETSHGNPE